MRHAITMISNAYTRLVLLLALLLIAAACAAEPDAPLPTLMELPDVPVTVAPTRPAQIPLLVSWEPVQGTLDAGGSALWQFFLLTHEQDFRFLEGLIFLH